MKCPSEVELNEFAEDRLDSRRRWEIQEHLTECARCSGDLEGLDWITGCLGVIDTAEESAGVEHPADADLAALAEGRAAPDLKAELLSHLSVCAECARVFGSLPRKAGKFTISRSFYGFAAAAVLLVAVGLAAFTGQFAQLGQAVRTMNATQMADATRPDTDPAAEEKAPAPPAAIVAQTPAQEPAPEPKATAAVSKPAQTALRTGQQERSRPRRSVSARRTRSGSLNNTQIAMGPSRPLPETVSEIAPPAAPGAASGQMKTFDVTRNPAAPISPARPAAAVKSPAGAAGAESTRPSATADGVEQRAQTKSQMIQQTQQTPTASKKKSATKSAAKSVTDDEGKPKQELAKSGSTASNAGKSKVKSADAGSQDDGGSNHGSAAGTGHAQSLAGHASADTGQSPPGSQDA